MPENYSDLCCFADAGEICRLDVRKSDGFVTVVAENARKRDCFSYRREKDGHIVFEQFETGHVMRMLIVTHDAFQFYLGAFLIECDREDTIALCGGDLKQNLSVTADSDVIIEKGQKLTANTAVIRGAQSFVINGTIIAQSLILQNCRNIGGGMPENCLQYQYFTENLCLNL